MSHESDQDELALTNGEGAKLRTVPWTSSEKMDTNVVVNKKSKKPTQINFQAVNKKDDLKIKVEIDSKCK
jgi:hypothetical protein